MKEHSLFALTAFHTKKNDALEVELKSTNEAKKSANPNSTAQQHKAPIVESTVHLTLGSMMGRR